MNKSANLSFGDYFCFFGFHKYKPHYKLLTEEIYKRRYRNVTKSHYQWHLALWGKHEFVHDKCERCGYVRKVSYDDGYD